MKTSDAAMHRGFESHSLRHDEIQHIEYLHTKTGRISDIEVLSVLSSSRSLSQQAMHSAEFLHPFEGEFRYACNRFQRQLVAQHFQDDIDLTLFDAAFDAFL